jgi:hypothetical protein
MDSADTFTGWVPDEVIVEDSQGPVGAEDYSEDDTQPSPTIFEYPPPDQVRIGPYYVPQQSKAADDATMLPFVNQATMGGLAPAVAAAPPAPSAAPAPSAPPAPPAAPVPAPPAPPAAAIVPAQGVVIDRRGKYVARGLIPDATMAQLTLRPYDTLWMINNAADQSVLSSFKSKMKFETMFAHGVFRVGDVFRIVAASGAIMTDKEATVSKMETQRGLLRK